LIKCLEDYHVLWIHDAVKLSLGLRIKASVKDTAASQQQKVIENFAAELAVQNAESLPHFIFEMVKFIYCFTKLNPELQHDSLFQILDERCVMAKFGTCDGMCAPELLKILAGLSNCHKIFYSNVFDMAQYSHVGIRDCQSLVDVLAGLLERGDRHVSRESVGLVLHLSRKVSGDFFTFSAVTENEDIEMTDLSDLETFPIMSEPFVQSQRNALLQLETATRNNRALLTQIQDEKEVF